MTSPSWLPSLESLAASNSIRLVRPSDADFDEINLCYIRRPACQAAAIVRPKNAEDVSTLIKYCTSHSAPFVIRSGGHDSSGRSQVAGALAIDMREMNKTTISADGKTAKVEGGALLSQVSDALGEENLVTPVGIISSVGYIGWATGAGYGPFAKSLGMGVDQILAARLVNWEGDIIDADEELLKGLRGAGPTFGAIVELTIKVYPLDTVSVINIIIKKDPTLLRCRADNEQRYSLGSSCTIPQTSRQLSINGLTPSTSSPKAQAYHLPFQFSSRS